MAVSMGVILYNLEDKVNGWKIKPGDAFRKFQGAADFIIMEEV